MFTELWKSLSGSFDKRWLRNLFLPALVFWGGGLWICVQVTTGFNQALTIWQGYALEEQIFLGAVGLLIVFFTTILLEAFEGPLLRFYEGYWFFWTGLAGRRKKTLEKKHHRRRELRARVAAGQATLREQAQLSRIDTELAHRPRNADHSMPTQLGDILRAAEDYAREQYGLDPIVFWPRLFPHLGDALREALGATQEQLDLALRLATLSALYGIIWSVVVALNRAWLMLWWTLPALPIAWLLWRSAHQIAIGYTGLLRSGFDLHRFEVYEALHWPKPSSPQTEIAHGVELTLYLLQETGAKEIVYTHEGEEEEKAQSAAEPTIFQVVLDWIGKIIRSL
jgi:hypothetical protein